MALFFVPLAVAIGVVHIEDEGNLGVGKAEVEAGDEELHLGAFAGRPVACVMLLERLGEANEEVWNIRNKRTYIFVC